ncbi:MAG: hypothetical protein U5K73_08415 [Halofilum sp. (in: g-proteobacteria)]|nr:hypothetical protein [Halofilum sp. (in: g-proteobacteria)]
MISDYQAEEEKRAENSARFWERKGQFTYYIVSLPFAFAGIAIASYPYPASADWLLVSFELLAWGAFLGAGVCGLFAKWGEMEQFRRYSLLATGRIQNANSTRDGGMQEYKGRLARRQESKLQRAETAESKGGRWLYALLGLGLLAWFMSRAILAVAAVF